MVWCAMRPVGFIARIAAGLPGMVSAGTWVGAAATPIAIAASTDATAKVANARHGASRSAAISAEISTIQTRLMAPTGEQGGHQRPAAAEAPRAVLHPHAQRPVAAVPPAVEEKPAWTSTTGEACAPVRCQLVECGG